MVADPLEGLAGSGHPRSGSGTVRSVHRSEDRRAWWLWCGGLVAVSLLSLRPTEPTDAWMYAATGRWILDNRTIPRVDPMSWTFAGHPWQSNGWGWGVIADLVLRIGGDAGLSLLKPIFAALLALAIVFAARTLGARLVPALAASLVVVAVSGPWIVERPQLASFVLFPLSIALAARAATEEGIAWRWLTALAVTFVLWANLHSVVLQGALIVGTFLAAQGIEVAVRRRDLRRLVPSAVVGVVVVLASFCTPYGLGVLTYSSRVRDISKASITEWFPVWRGGPDAAVPAVALVVTAIAVVWLRAWRRPALLAPLVLCWLFTLDAIRNAPYLAIAIAVFLVPLLPPRVVLAGRHDLATVGVAAMVVVSILVTAPRLGGALTVSPEAPVAATEALPAGCRLRNDYRVGGWVLYHRPDVPVSVDGRNDVYGLEGYGQQHLFETVDGASQAPERFRAERVTCVVALPGDPIVEALTRAGWRRVADDGGGVLLVEPES